MLTCAGGTAVRTIFSLKKIPEPPYQRLIGLDDEERNCLCVLKGKGWLGGFRQLCSLVVEGLVLLCVMLFEGGLQPLSSVNAMGLWQTRIFQRRTPLFQGILLMSPFGVRPQQSFFFPSFLQAVFSVLERIR